MQRNDFYYELPAELIATHPVETRSASRLLGLDPVADTLEDMRFADFPELLEPGDLLVFNDTRVIPARLVGTKSTGGRVELLIERVTGANTALAHVRASKSPGAGTRLLLEGDVSARISGREGDLFLVEFPGSQDVLELLEAFGHMPLPPYIKREDEQQDRHRYQTIYARTPGAVAAPTAGLHFDDAVMDRLGQRGVETAFVTLHVGAGTFQPVRVDNIEEHVMHHEYFEVDADVCRMVTETRRRGGRVVAVGTTVVRSLESASQSGEITPYRGETNLFITPGYRFRCVDALLTNFHLPESTLLMLVCAFAGRERVMSAYRHAIRAGYRFFSYGDAMFIKHRADAR
ncbi:MAG: tRNA preQ1(34) S-adenosylmethionine ribosyltransferase-isomerase QueA [Gammaproteobacteria bacterium]|nr:tRNA preQ1(34) S-adenosylmethionine ribosyltransferase-isomerase QueA [Gammaproteobacteria bacterium]